MRKVKQAEVQTRHERSLTREEVCFTEKDLKNTQKSTLVFIATCLMLQEFCYTIREA